MKNRKKTKEGAAQMPRSREEPGDDDRAGVAKMDPLRRAAARLLWSGGVKTGVRMHRDGLRSTSTCPFCWKENEDEEHLFWKCEVWEPHRTKLRNQFPKAELDALPTATRLSGIVSDDGRLDDLFSRIATSEDIEEEMPPIPAEEILEEAEQDDEGYLLVARDGAAP